MKKIILHNLQKVLFIVIINLSYSQTTIIKGNISDSIQIPLSSANIFAEPIEENIEIVYANTDKLGNYILQLRKHKTYKITVSYLGYKPKALVLKTDVDTIKNFILNPISESLEDVILEYTPPIVIKKDTISFKTDKFVTGEERKLREVLKKLPGVEVDRDGNVTVNGKQVDKLLVEGKEFFTGDTKLGVNNIPADAVDEVVAINNYNEIPFLKGLNDSDKLALNIKLKEGKKKFAFGDIELGAGIEDRYVVHPNLFYYSPKTSINTIGDFNNTGQKAFTFSDYINFEGGFTKLLDDPVGYFSLSNSAFAQSLLNQDFVFNRNNFGAFNIAQQLGKHTNVNAYTIVNHSNVDTRVENTNTYFVDNTITDIENRATSSQSDNTFTLSKATLKYVPNFKEDLTYKVVVKTSNGNTSEQLNSLSTRDTNTVSTNAKPSSLELLQNVSYSKQFSQQHTTTITGDFKYTEQENANNWLFSDAIFSNLIPLEDDMPFNILQRVDSKSTSASVSLKHYWVLNNFNHIYPVLGYNYVNQSYNSNNSQILDGTTNSFQNANFNNQNVFKLHDTYVGFEYKAKIGEVIIKLGLIYHNYNWMIDQFDISQTTTEKGQLLPELDVKWDITSSEKIRLKYNLRSQFRDASNFANRLRLNSFNSIFMGNDALENELTHRASLNYYKFSLLKGLFYNLGFNYNKTVRAVRNTTLIEGIDQVNTLFYTDAPENRYSLNGSISKKIRKLKFTVTGNASLADYSRLINNEFIGYESQSFGYLLKAETSFKNLPNLEVGFRQDFNDFSSATFENNFVTTNPYAILEYDFLNDFILKSDYSYSNYRSEANNVDNNFQIANASLYYNKEDSPWGFEAEARNLFDVGLKNENSVSQFIVNDTRIFIQPRTFLFKLSYRF